MTLAALYGLLAGALLLGIGISLLPHGWRRLPLAVAAASLALTPLFDGESPAMWVHGILGAPSVTLMALTFRRLTAPTSPALLNLPAATTLLGVGLVFYALALGWGPYDPYALGYQPLPLLLALLPLAAWLAWRRQDAWLTVLGFCLLAYAAGIFGNLWNALFDPLLILLAAAKVAKGIVRP